MPYCKNNSKRSYIGTEPSPKGLGYCASGEKEGKTMKGKDGNNWIVSNNKWIKSKEYNLDKIIKKLYKKFNPWFTKISSQGFYIIYTNNSYKFYIPTKEESKNKFKNLELDTNIKYIIWTSQSSDSLTFFINYILQKKNNLEIEEILKMRNTLDYFLNNIKQYFIKSKLYTNKDYSLKYINEINENLIIKKLKKSIILEKLL